MKLGRLLFILISASLGIAPAQAYYGRYSSEAQLSYEAVADLKFDLRPNLADLNEEGPARKKALELLDLQIQHLMGTFQSQSFQEETGFAAVLGESYSIQFTEVSQAATPSRTRVKYRFNGKIVVDKRAFKASKELDVPIKLPLAPDRIYALGVVRGKNRCTDEHYNTEGDFWYFWDPDQKGCPLNENDTEVLRLSGRLKSLPNTRLSYPEYDKLYGANGNGKSLEIAIFLGYIDDIEDFKRPHQKDDVFGGFKYIQEKLSEKGFEIAESRDKFRETSNGHVIDGINFLRRYTAPVKTPLGTIQVNVEVLVADTSIDSRDETFHRHLESALEKADIVVYDGHSGLGGNLDLSQLPEIQLDPNKYQIFFFNGCSTYPYFNGAFFKAKSGSRNLELLNSGLSTLSDSSGPNVFTFVESFLDGKTISYQKILSNLEFSNGDNGTYLVGVNGDEDNRWKPAK